MLVEVEQLIQRKHVASQSPKSGRDHNTWPEINFVNDKLLHKLQQLGNQLLPHEEGTSEEAECFNIMV